MYLTNHYMANDRGATLIIVMLVLVAVTALGLSAMNISTTEVNLAGNDKWQKTGFYNADPGVHGSPTVISPNLNPEQDAPVAPAADDDPNGCLAYLNENADPNEFKQIVYMSKLQPNDPICQSNDISFRKCNIDVDIDVCPQGSVALSGGGVEFMSRAEGLGASGSEGKLFLITGSGDGAGNSTYRVQGHYRWVEAAGGLK